MSDWVKLPLQVLFFCVVVLPVMLIAVGCCAVWDALTAAWKGLQWLKEVGR